MTLRVPSVVLAWLRLGYSDAVVHTAFILQFCSKHEDRTPHIYTYASFQVK